MINLPKIIGHRGVASYAPENTIAGIHTAADMGLTWVELDVKLTKDDVPIIFHDDMLDRTTNGTGLVKDHTFAELRELDCGSWFSESFTGLQIPSLEEIIDILIDLDIGFNLEIKPCEGRDTDTAAIALDMMAQYWDAHDKLLISSFSYTALETAMEMASDWHRGLLLPPDVPENWTDLVEFFRPKTVNISQKTATRALCQQIMDLDKRILCYTVNDAPRARELQSFGVDAFFSDAPDVIEDALLIVH